MFWNPYNSDYSIKCGECYKHLNVFDNAEIYFTKALEIDGEAFDNHCKYERLCKNIYKHELAASQYKKALDVEPNNCNIL